MRAMEPGRFRELARARRRRPLLAPDGRLLLVAADHPARGALGVADDPTAMADRYELLRRLVLALDTPGVDGVLATPDIVDDLLFLGALDEKIVAGSINRSGLSRSLFELDDRPTAYSPHAIHRDRLDFAKVLLRVDLADRGTVNTLEAVGRAVSESAELELPVMIEPFMSSRLGDRVVNQLTTEALLTVVAIASGLGDTSAYTWLKIPVVPDMERVMASTTLPTLLLGGDPSGDMDDLFDGWQDALRLPGVRGLVAGRTLLYPPDGDVEGAITTAVALTHEGDQAAVNQGKK